MVLQELSHETGAPSAYMKWFLERTQGQEFSPTDYHPLADIDGDRITNYVEYRLQTDPTQFDRLLSIAMIDEQQIALIMKPLTENQQALLQLEAWQAGVPKTANDLLGDPVTLPEYPHSLVRPILDVSSGDNADLFFYRFTETIPPIEELNSLVGE